jgi:hypothetical protein
MDANLVRLLDAYFYNTTLQLSQSLLLSQRCIFVILIKVFLLIQPNHVQVKYLKISIQYCTWFGIRDLNIHIILRTISLEIMDKLDN